MQAANVQQITGRSFITSSLGHDNDPVDLGSLTSDVAWNQNDMFKNDATSQSSGGRGGADFPITKQVRAFSLFLLAVDV
jgi:hypothetical protein